MHVPVEVTVRRMSPESDFLMKQRRHACQRRRSSDLLMGCVLIWQGPLSSQGSRWCFLSWCSPDPLSQLLLHVKRPPVLSCPNLTGEGRGPPSNSGPRGSSGRLNVLEFSVSRCNSVFPIVPPGSPHSFSLCWG